MFTINIAGLTQCLRTHRELFGVKFPQIYLEDTITIEMQSRSKKSKLTWFVNCHQLGFLWWIRVSQMSVYANLFVSAVPFLVGPCYRELEKAM